MKSALRAAGQDYPLPGVTGSGKAFTIAPETRVARILAQVHIPAMSTMTEIQQAIEGLPAKEKKALSVWLSSQQESEMSAEEEAALLASLDKAGRQLDAGLGVPIEQVRGMVGRWASK